MPNYGKFYSPFDLNVTYKMNKQNSNNNNHRKDAKEAKEKWNSYKKKKNAVTVVSTPHLLFGINSI